MPVGEIGILEMEQFVISGVSEMDTLIAATRNAADVMGLLDVLGTVEAGKLADLVVVDGNPLDNISNIRNIKMVFKDGIEVDLDQQLGTAGYWDYFGSTGSMSGYLGKAENAAGFQRGATEPEGQPEQVRDAQAAVSFAGPAATMGTVPRRFRFEP